MTLPDDRRALFRLALAIVAAITLVRIVVLIISPLQLYPDEAQYWWWAHNLDWGYFSKPPLIAWIIRATTFVGDPEWAVRLASPILHGVTALVLFGVGRLAFDARTGFWSALAYASLPGVSYSSGLISTDVPLLLCWVVALYALLQARDDPRWRWAIIAGVALGLGLLAKYAMGYFILCAVFATVFDAKARAVVLSWRGMVVLIIGLAILSPNLIWNAAHGWPTLAHTESNANWGHARFNFGNAGAFVAGQFGVFGPLMMAAFLAALWDLLDRSGRSGAAIVLAAYSIPVLLLIVIQSFISEANANWAAPAYIAAVPLAVTILLRWWKGVALLLSLGMAGVVMLALWLGQAAPGAADRAGLGNALKRQQGWCEIGAAVASEARARPYDAIAASNRSLLAELTYYARPRAIPLRAWDANPKPRDHFQMTMPLTTASHRVLLVLAPDESANVLASFDSAKPVRQLAVPVGGHRVRTLALYDGRGFHPPQPKR